MRFQMFNSFVLILFIVYLKLICSAKWHYIYNLQRVESIYESDVFAKGEHLNHPHSSICNLTEIQKTTLCQQLFNKRTYPQIGMFLNKTAFHYLTAKCEPKVLTFFYKKHLNFAEIQQMMFPCFGRHDPMQTNYAVDNFFDMFYVSGDFVRNILFVYKMMKKVKTRVLKLHAVYFKVKYLDLNISPVIIRQADVQNELQLLQEMSQEKHRRTVETIYLREMYGRIIQNPICKLKIIDKILLCKRIFEKESYKMKYFVLNTAAFLASEPECEEKNLAFIDLLEYKGDIKQSMLPCFGKDASKGYDALWQDDRFLRQFSISSGPIANSVLLYYQLGNADSNLYNIYELIHNVHFEISDPVENEERAIKELLTKIERDNSRFIQEPGLPPQVYLGIDNDSKDEEEKEEEEKEEEEEEEEIVGGQIIPIKLN